jgi:putative ABC transport system permease protein
MTLMQIAFNNLRRRKAKALFVMLGLAIGIATIVSVFSVLEAMKAEMSRQMAEYGANILITANTGELAFTYGGISIPGTLFDVEQLTTQDVSAIDTIQARQMVRTVVPKLLGVLTVNGNEVIIAGSNLKGEFSIKPWLRINDLLAKANSAKVNNTGSGSGSGMAGEKLDLVREDYTRIELSGQEVILGAEVAYTLGLFPSNTFEINGQEFTVKAILEKNGTAEDHQVLLNLPVAQQLLGFSDEVTTIELAADYAAGSEDVLLNQIRTLLPHAKVTSLRKVMLDRDEIVTRLTHFGVSVAILVLIVGTFAASLGLSAAVRERTREIGIFRAIGFRKSHIRKMILIEGLVLSLIGGFVGFTAGTALAKLVAPLLADTALTIPWRLDVLTISLVLAVIVGALASLYPAQQAAKLDPTEALRFI